MYNYKAIYKPNQLITGTGQIAIISGWTIAKSVAKKLNETEYAVIGQLYSSTRGINFLIRNLLANPHVRDVVAIAATQADHNSGSSRCLFDFFQNGYYEGISDTGKRCWVIRSEIPGYIDIDIPQCALDTLKEFICCRLVDNVGDAIAFVRKSNLFAQDTPLFPWGESLTFPMVESKPTVLPGSRYGHRIEGKTIAETWVKIIHRIKTTGTIRPTGYDGQWQELIDLTAVVTDEPDNFYFPEPNYLPIDRTFLNEYIPQMVNDAPYQEGVKYTYGQRLRSHFGRDQVEQVINKLIGEIDAASAVMNLWDVVDHEKGGSPCLNHIWVRVVDGELSLTATFRSNDMFSAWVANAMGLRALQKHILDEINTRRAGQTCPLTCPSDYDGQVNAQVNLRMGALITVSQSAHIYDDCWENADRLIDNQYQTIINNRDYFDPSGNFLIEVENGGIVVTQTTPGSGEVVNCFRGNNPLRLVREICASSPSIQPEHIGYLGIELEKARKCLRDHVTYRQDFSANA